MDVQAHEDVAAAAAAHSELGHEYEGALAEGLIERISSEIDKQVDTRPAQRGIQPTHSAWTSDDQDPNFPAMMTFRHASVGTSSLNRVAATSRLLLPLAAGKL
jgi:hypothetical protein